MTVKSRPSSTLSRRVFVAILLFGLGGTYAPESRAWLCDASRYFCGNEHGHSSGGSSGAPTRGTEVRINPSAVPLEKSLGLEGIFYDNSVDLAIVKGLGRVGAAISPSNSEETFFGPPSIEDTNAYLQRKQDRAKYASQKITLATAVGVIDNKSSGIRRLELNAGVMGKYNKFTHRVSPGGGISGVAGPLTFGYSYYRDQTQIPQDLSVTNYNVQTYSIGAFLNSVAIDYSYLKMTTTSVSSSYVLTGTLLLGKSLTTLALRREESSRPSYNFATQSLDYVTEKKEFFAGFQYSIFPHLMVGLFYNYYLLREISVGTTLFF